jgi:hypothetical protein
MVSPSGTGPVAKFFRTTCELRENAAQPKFWLQGWVLRRSTPYLWLRRNRFGRAQFPHKPRAEKLCDRPVLRAPAATGRLRRWPMCSLLDGILYLLRTGSPSQPARVEAATEASAGAVARVGEHNAKPHAALPQAVEVSQGDLSLSARYPYALGHTFVSTRDRPPTRRAGTGARRPAEVPRPGPGSVRPGLGSSPTCPADHSPRATLARNADRQSALLRQDRVVDHQTGARPPTSRSA